MSQKMIMQFYTVSCFLIVILGLSACNKHVQDKHPDIIQGKATSDGTIAFFNTVTNRQLEFKPCLNRHYSEREQIQDRKSNEKIRPCSSVSKDATLISTETITIHKFQQPYNSVQCCIEFSGSAIQACYIETGNVCRYGQPSN